MPNSDMYCGIGPIPKGKVAGTQEYCIQTKQVRLWGKNKIDKNKLSEASRKTPDLVKEQLKLKKIEDNAKILIKEVRNLKVILEREDVRPSDLKKAQKRMDQLLIKRDKLVKQLKTQQKIVKAAEEEERMSRKKSSSGRSLSSGRSSSTGRSSSSGKSKKSSSKKSSSGSKRSKKSSSSRK